MMGREPWNLKRKLEQGKLETISEIYFLGPQEAVEFRIQKWILDGWTF
jgi:hypothetical protein